MRSKGAWLADAARYVLSGAGATVTDFSLYTLLHYLGQWPPTVANLVSRPAGGVVSFVLHRRFTFQNRGAAPLPVQMARYVTIWILSFGISQALVWAGYRLAGLEAVTTKILAEGVAVIFAFTSHRCWTFSRGRERRQ